jgi:DNA-binding protein WhiA
VWGSAVKEELSSAPVVGPLGPVRRLGEVVALLRFADAVQVSTHRVQVVATVDSVSVARRLRTALWEMFGAATEGWVSDTGAGRVFAVRVVATDEALARRLGLLGPYRQLVRGLPAGLLLAGDLRVVEAVWRGAFLARGALSAPTHPAVLSVACPSVEAAVALVGGARRLGVKAVAAESRGRCRVLVRGESNIGMLLDRLEAPGTAARWARHRKEHRHARAATATATATTATTATATATVTAAALTTMQISTGDRGLHTSNHARTLQAAGATIARVHRALLLLGDEVPDALAAAAALRIAHPEVSLDALAALADPRVTKDAMAGRLRRLLNTADRHARTTGQPDTTTTTPHPDNPDAAVPPLHSEVMQTRHMSKYILSAL